MKTYNITSSENTFLVWFHKNLLFMSQIYKNKVDKWWGGACPDCFPVWKVLLDTLAAHGGGTAADSWGDVIIYNGGVVGALVLPASPAWECQPS